jgi:hypothetical protein
MAALKWGGAIGGAAVAKASAEVLGSYMAHKARMKTDPNYEYETRRRYSQQYGRAYDKNYKNNMKEETARFPHTRQAMKGSNLRQAAWVSVTRSMATDKVGTAGKALMNNKKYQLPRRTNTSTKIESASDTIIMRAGELHEAIPLVGAAVGAIGRIAGSALAKTAVKSAVSGAASSIGSSVASKAMAPKKRKAEEIEEGWGTMLAGLTRGAKATAGSIASGKVKSQGARKAAAGAVQKAAEKAGDKRSYAQKGWDKFKSSDTGKKVIDWSKTKGGKRVIQKGAEGLAKGIGTGVGTGIGNRVGRRIEHGSKRQQISRARHERRLARIRGRYEGIEETTVSPSARSQFEINPVRDTKQYLHMKRNAYIERKSQVSKKAKMANISRLAKPDETQNESLQEMKASKILKMAGKETGKKAWGVMKKHPGKVATGAAALGAYGAWKKRRTNRKYQEKMVAHHEKHYNRHVANLDYLDDIAAAKERRASAFK